MAKKNKGLKSQMKQLSALLREVPDQEEVVLSLRESVIEKLHPLLRRALGEANMQIEFPCLHSSYFLGAGGWSTKLRSHGITARQIAESCTEEIFRTSLSSGIEKLIKEMKRRQKEANSEKDNLLNLLSCLSEIQKQ